MDAKFRVTKATLSAYERATREAFFGRTATLGYSEPVTTLRHIHRYMNDRRRVLLADGRTGKIVRVDTVFPANDTTVTVWMDEESCPGVTKVRLDDVVGVSDLAPEQRSVG